MPRSARIASKHSSTVETSAPSRTGTPWRLSAASQKVRHASGDLRATKGWSTSCSTLTSLKSANGDEADTTRTRGFYEEGFDAEPVLNQDGRSQERDVDRTVGKAHVGIGEIVGAHLDVDPRVQVVECVEDSGCQLGRRIGLKADDEAAVRSAAARILGLPGESLGLGEQTSAAVQEQLAGRGELDVPTGADEQRRVQGVLQLADLNAQRRLRDV